MKKLLFLFLLSSLNMIGQTDSEKTAYVSKNGLYQIEYDSAMWQQSTVESLWDAEFHDNYNLANAYFMELGYFLPDDKIKETIKAQFDALGKVKNLRINKKQVNGIPVNYFECELKYEGYSYTYQGFLYNGAAGTIELQFGTQTEGLATLQPKIDAFCNGFSIIK